MRTKWKEKKIQKLFNLLDKGFFYPLIQYNNNNNKSSQFFKILEERTRATNEYSHAINLFLKVRRTYINLVPCFMRADDEAWLGQLREIRLGEERAETDLEEGSQREHLRRVEHGGDHRRWPRHSVHHGPSRRIQARQGLDSREPRLRYREYPDSIFLLYFIKRLG